MPAQPDSLQIESWVGAAPPAQREFREAVHVVLSAIAHSGELRSRMVMKGGILLALRYRSSRFTKDIDFSTSLTRADLVPENIRDEFTKALPLAGEGLDYGLDCAVQKFEIMPPNEGATFPSIRMRIGYAPKGTPKHKRLLAGACPDIISIDFSLNEPVLNTESLPLGGTTEGSILTYAFADIFAEKIRALLQQETRNRYRRQDIYDLHFLLSTHPPDGAEKLAILESLQRKASSRSIRVHPDSMASAEVRRRAEYDYPTLADEVDGELPDFDDAYRMVAVFYRELPWQG